MKFCFHDNNILFFPIPCLYKLSNQLQSTSDFLEFKPNTTFFFFFSFSPSFFPVLPSLLPFRANPRPAPLLLLLFLPTTSFSLPPSVLLSHTPSPLLSASSPPLSSLLPPPSSRLIRHSFINIPFGRRLDSFARARPLYNSDLNTPLSFLLHSALELWYSRLFICPSIRKRLFFFFFFSSSGS
ncbi:hypothetical protein P170DRAFT_223392 [Aspergillus steynii IBT 23096]|uniref:Uncharacterized protein n=1 Tax=Aspergillus steynii IBT 23096 TaxID=1392250 RepID=A0A2I2G1Q2_9EURO|nr:uncharacterized protein P170DRAFT_223392 [Aspergillus steynii IBT 23096]PLB46799.1 hypothetical protein P170DRAFT_223392 [Aspergillus steynii IBT 23096]